MARAADQSSTRYRQTDRQKYTDAAHDRALDAVERIWERMHAAHRAGDEDAYTDEREALHLAWQEVRRIVRLPGGLRRG
jgi:hypothetical protein